MFKYVAYVGKVRFASEDKQQLQEILRRDRDRKVQAEREKRERAIRKETAAFLQRYQSYVFRYGNAEGLLCNKLWQFRLELEGQAQQPIGDVKVSAALLLSDLCVFAGLSEAQHARVFGQEGTAYVNEVLTRHYNLKASGPGTTARQ